jgi:hypothetical protein
MIAAMDEAPLTEADLAAMEARASAATMGPWTSFVEGRDHSSGSSFVQTDGEDIELSRASVADQDFIAHARQDVPRLVAEVRRLRKSANLTGL